MTYQQLRDELVRDTEAYVRRIKALADLLDAGQRAGRSIPVRDYKWAYQFLVPDCRTDAKHPYVHVYILARKDGEGYNVSGAFKWRYRQTLEQVFVLLRDGLIA
jgi:hypothetical protein